MPEISRFFGISIETLSILEGTLQSRAYGLVVEWASLHQTELGDVWERVKRMEPLGRIAPLE